MGSATTQAVAATTAALDAASAVDLDVARELFAAARVVASSSQLGGALADSAAAPEARTKVVTDLFSSAFSPVTVGLLSTAVEHSWSTASDLVECEADEVRGDPASLSARVHAQGLEPPRACGGGGLVDAVEAVAVQRDHLRDEGGLRFRGVRAEKRDGARALTGDRDDPLGELTTVFATLLAHLP